MSSQGNNADTLADAITVAARRLLADERRSMKGHPEVDELVAFQEGRLPEERADEVRRHLTLCPECARDVLELAVFDEPPATSASEEDNRRSWESFQRHLAEEKADPPRASGTVVAFEPGARTVASGGAPAAPRWMLAASLLLTLTGVAAWWATLTERGRAPQEPAPQELGAPFPFVLRPDGTSQVRDSAPATVVEVPAAADALVPTLLIGDLTSYPEYRAELRTAAGELVFAKDDLPRHRDGSFSLLIPRSRVPPGPYTLRLFGDDGETARLLAAYSFSIRAAS